MVHADYKDSAQTIIFILFIFSVIPLN